ncbi:hypothetical protein [Alkalidesulfovibrio alkalitolerans]|uniref:hypothetical protein n=1 Tax=Alkalidesulfovibrio alkalitolerans TaxID=293256 RepID=UPI001267A70F|nr:hypothetical protein [Alkalidesulfovibrio alkalitolerans]
MMVFMVFSFFGPEMFLFPVGADSFPWVRSTQGNARANGARHATKSLPDNNNPYYFRSLQYFQHSMSPGEPGAPHCATPLFVYKSWIQTNERRSQNSASRGRKAPSEYSSGQILHLEINPRKRD